MSCENCIYWDGGYKTTQANCTRNPVWVKTTPKHFCGEFKAGLIRDYSDNSKVPGHLFWENLVDFARSTTKEYFQINTKLRKENKELREMYKKDTGKIARVKPLKKPQAAN